MTSPATIERDAFYSQYQVKLLLRISIRSIGDACRAGELRHTQRAGQRFFRGSWLIEWLEGQEGQNQPAANAFLSNRKTTFVTRWSFNHDRANRVHGNQATGFTLRLRATCESNATPSRNNETATAFRNRFETSPELRDTRGNAGRNRDRNRTARSKRMPARFGSS